MALGLGLTPITCQQVQQASSGCGGGFFSSPQILTAGLQTLALRGKAQVTPSLDTFRQGIYGDLVKSLSLVACRLGSLPDKNGALSEEG